MNVTPEEADENERAFAERAAKRRAYIAALPADTPELERAAISAYMEFFPGPHKWENSEEACKAWMRRVAGAVIEVLDTSSRYPSEREMELDRRD